MKKIFALFLVLSVCISLFCGCGNSDPSIANQNTNGSSANSSSNTASSNENQSGNNSANEPFDVLTGLPYTLSCIDKYSGQPAEYVFSDNNRLNDGLYRGKTDLEQETASEMRVDFDGTASYNFVITFEADGSYDGYRLVLHNNDLRFSILKIEMGSNTNNLKEIDFEDDDQVTANMHADSFADFENTTIETVRITLTTGTSATASFDEISLLGFPKGQGDQYKKPEDSKDTSSETNGENDARLIGTWGADDPEIVEKGGSDYKVVMTFVSDGTGTYQQAGMNLPLTWTTANNVLTMEVVVGTLTKPYSFDNGNLYLPDEDGRTTTFVKLQ